MDEETSDYKDDDIEDNSKDHENKNGGESEDVEDKSNYVLRKRRDIDYNEERIIKRLHQGRPTMQSKITFIANRQSIH